MSTTCHTCPIAVECAALPHGMLGCQDNGARFDAPQAPADDAAVLAPYRVTAAANIHGCSRFPCQDAAEFGRCFAAPCPTLPRPFEDCDRPCSIECDRMTCDRDGGE